jgi:poly-gamma-glutamate synthesis protein (capsule biosynthesis protein)
MISTPNRYACGTLAALALTALASSCATAPSRTSSDPGADEAAERATSRARQRARQVRRGAASSTEIDPEVLRRRRIAHREGHSTLDTALTAAHEELERHHAVLRSIERDPLVLLERPELRGRRDLVITAVGDVSQPADRWVKATEKLGADAFAPTAALVAEADLAIMNLENPISNSGPKAEKTYSFTSPPERLGWYFDVGFDVFSLANNHMGDAGQKGIDDTIRHLRETSEQRDAPAWFAGAGADREAAERVTWIEPEGKDLKIAYFSTGISSHANVSKFWLANLDERIRKARAEGGADLVIVSVHAGKEYQHLPGDSVKKYYRKWVDAGADLVIGHHPHVIRPVEVYKQGIIYYSLGNYVFMSRTVRHRKSNAKLYGLMTRIVVRDGVVRGAELVPLWVNNSESWKLETGEVLPNADFVPKILTGKFADAWFTDFNKWSRDAGATVPERRKDRGVLTIDADATSNAPPADPADSEDASTAAKTPSP